jgi:hypothetical protein
LKNHYSHEPKIKELFHVRECESLGIFLGNWREILWHHSIVSVSQRCLFHIMRMAINVCMWVRLSQTTHIRSLFHPAIEKVFIDLDFGFDFIFVTTLCQKNMLNRLNLLCLKMQENWNFNRMRPTLIRCTHLSLYVHCRW